jgi:hypothetical protein
MAQVTQYQMKIETRIIHGKACYNRREEAYCQTLLVLVEFKSSFEIENDFCAFFDIA